MSSSSRVVGATGRENRRDKRRSFDISAVLNNQPVIISDFSLGGVSIAGFEIPQKDRPTLRVGDHALLTLFQADGEVAETFDVEIVRAIGPDGHFGLEFHDLDDAQYRVVETLVMRPQKFAKKK